MFVQGSGMRIVIPRSTEGDGVGGGGGRRGGGREAVRSVL